MADYYGIPSSSRARSSHVDSTYDDCSDSGVGDGSARVVLSLCSIGNRIGAASFDASTGIAQLFVDRDLDNDFMIIQDLMIQVQPTDILIDKKLQPKAKEIIEVS